jgi:hypothetical protein
METDRLEINEKIYPSDKDIRAGLFFTRSTRDLLCSRKQIQVMTDS